MKVSTMVSVVSDESVNNGECSFRPTWYFHGSAVHAAAIAGAVAQRGPPTLVTVAVAAAVTHPMLVTALAARREC